MDTTTIIGFFAAVCTSVSYFPQLKKCWDIGKAEDLSPDVQHPGNRRRYLVLYGVFKRDLVVIVANAVSLCCLAGILWFKLREKPSTV